MLLPAQLPAGGVDIGAERTPHGNVEPALFQYPAKRFQMPARAAVMCLARHVVRRDEIDVAQHALKLVRQLMRARVGIVDAVHHRIFKGNAPSGRYQIIPGRQQAAFPPATYG